jgi:hypothetical protein
MDFDTRHLFRDREDSQIPQGEIGQLWRHGNLRGLHPTLEGDPFGGAQAAKVPLQAR